MKSQTKNPSKSSLREADLGVVTRVLRLRLKDKHASYLRPQAKEVNFVWNYTQDLGLKVLEREGRFVSAFDVAAYTKGAGKEGLTLHSQTIQAISEEYVLKRKQFKKAKLRWRVSGGSKRSLGWIPFKTAAISYKNGQLHYQGKPISLWDSYGLSDYDLRSGCFSEDARGRWYVNITVEKKVKAVSKELPTDAGFVGPVGPVGHVGSIVPVKPKKAAVGIDLGLRELAAFSDPEMPPVDAQKFYGQLEEKLAVAQRAGKKDRAKAIHAKIANSRKDCLHKLSTKLVNEYKVIVVGNVSSSKLAKTKMAKSVLDSGWGMFKTQLKYKSHEAAGVFKEVNESYSTQECSACGSRSGPKGLAGLGVSFWLCSCCGAWHDRNQNAARNILVTGLLEMTQEEALKAKNQSMSMSVEARAGETDVKRVMNGMSKRVKRKERPLSGSRWESSGPTKRQACARWSSRRRMHWWPKARR